MVVWNTHQTIFFSSSSFSFLSFFTPRNQILVPLCSLPLLCTLRFHHTPFLSIPMSSHVFFSLLNSLLYSLPITWEPFTSHNSFVYKPFLFFYNHATTFLFWSKSMPISFSHLGSILSPLPPSSFAFTPTSMTFPVLSLFLTPSQSPNPCFGTLSSNPTLTQVCSIPPFCCIKTWGRWELSTMVLRFRSLIKSLCRFGLM